MQWLLFCVALAAACADLSFAKSLRKRANAQGQCTGEYVKCANTDDCIKIKWICDQQNDCGDNSDEANCTVCPAGKFQCVSNGHCIFGDWVCDGDKDCSDGSDELPQNCPGATPAPGGQVQQTPAQTQTTCGPDQVMCSWTDQTCINLEQICDGKVDCPDGTDESGSCQGAATDSTTAAQPDVPGQTTGGCQPGQFQCNHGICVPGDWHCDGMQDCNEGEDELNCSAATTAPEQPDDSDSSSDSSTTAQPDIIDIDWPTDDASTPNPGSPVACTDQQFTCGDGTCIVASWKCDGEIDCNDGSDEIGCIRK